MSTASLGNRVTARYSVSMTSQHTDMSDLSVIAEPALQVWSSGSEKHGLDARLEVTRLDSEARVAVRDSRYPTGPALVFTEAGWNDLLTDQIDLVDLR
jgi:hypothetical protein